MSPRAGAATSRFFGTAERRPRELRLVRHNSGGKRGPTPVGQFRPNPLGLFDIYGNVDEWCEIWPLTPVTDVRAARGGSYRGFPKFMRSAMPHAQLTDAKFSTQRLPNCNHPRAPVNYSLMTRLALTGNI